MKSWEHAWSIDEIRKNAQQWSLAADVGVSIKNFGVVYEFIFPFFIYTNFNLIQAKIGIY